MLKWKPSCKVAWIRRRQVDDAPKKKKKNTAACPTVQGHCKDARGEEAVFANYCRRRKTRERLPLSGAFERHEFDDRLAKIVRL